MLKEDPSVDTTFDPSEPSDFTLKVCIFLVPTASLSNKMFHI